MSETLQINMKLIVAIVIIIALLSSFVPAFGKGADWVKRKLWIDGDLAIDGQTVPWLGRLVRPINTCLNKQEEDAPKKCRCELDQNLVNVNPKSGIVFENVDDDTAIAYQYVFETKAKSNQEKMDGKVCWYRSGNAGERGLITFGSRDDKYWVVGTLKLPTVEARGDYVIVYGKLFCFVPANEVVDASIEKC